MMELATNDLLYVPTDAEIDIMVFDSFTDVNGNIQNPAAQRTALKAFIAQDEYLSEQKRPVYRKVWRRNTLVQPVDLRILQDFNFESENQTNFTVQH